MKGERITLYFIGILIIISFFLFLYTLLGNIKIQGYSSETTTPSKVTIGVIVLSLCGNGTVESPYEECDDGNLIDGDGCSSTCEIEEQECNSTNPCPDGQTCVNGVCESPSPPSPPPEPGEPNIRIDPTEIKRSMLVNTNLEETIGITNLDTTSSVSMSVYSAGFDPDLIVTFWDDANKRWTSVLTLNIYSGGIEELRVRFSAPDNVGLYNGTIIIDGKRVNVTLNVQERLLLFDSNIIVLNPDYLVPQGDKLRTSVTLIPLGDKERMDVKLNYVVKDYDGKIYLTRSETVLVEDQVNFKRNFDTGVLPIGQYIISLELIYTNGVAPSSAHFEVIPGRQSTFFGKLVFFLINLILIVLILIIILIILRIIKKLVKDTKSREREEMIKKWTSGEKGKTKEAPKGNPKESPKEKGKSNEKGSMVK